VSRNRRSSGARIRTQKKHAPPLKTEADWIKAGEVVFDAAAGSLPLANRDPEGLGDYAAKRGIPLTGTGVLPFFEFRIVEKGNIEIGAGSCASCHTRLMADETLLKGAQGSIPFDRIVAEGLRVGLRGPIEAVRALERGLYAALWQRPELLAGLDEMSIEEIAAIHEVIPPGGDCTGSRQPLLSGSGA
jgi:hypothetical protein